jgi:hypothetical protein
VVSSGPRQFVVAESYLQIPALLKNCVTRASISLYKCARAEREVERATAAEKMKPASQAVKRTYSTEKTTALVSQQRIEMYVELLAKKTEAKEPLTTAEQKLMTQFEMNAGAIKQLNDYISALEIGLPNVVFEPPSDKIKQDEELESTSEESDQEEDKVEENDVKPKSFVPLTVTLKKQPVASTTKVIQNILDTIVVVLQKQTVFIVRYNI